MFGFLTKKCNKSGGEKLNCWEFKKCGREPGGVNVDKLGVCPAVTDKRFCGINSGKNGGRICWYVCGTYCGGKIQGSFSQKINSCVDCKFLKKVADEEKNSFVFRVNEDKIQKDTKSEIKKSTENDSIERLRNAFNPTIEHIKNLSELTVKIAHRMGMNETDIIKAKCGAILHDIGNLFIPDTILLKLGKLTDEEEKIFHQHPKLALNLLSLDTSLHAYADIPYCHHEKWDGSGFPQMLNGESIPLAARIFAVADTYESLISDKPYRKGFSKDKVLEYIRSQSGKHFDPAVVYCFMSLAKDL